MSFCPDIYEDFYDTQDANDAPPKKENPAYAQPWTLYIKTRHYETYQVDNVHDYGYSNEAKHYWYTTVDNPYRYNYVRADHIIYFGLKDYCFKLVPTDITEE